MKRFLNAALAMIKRKKLNLKHTIGYIQMEVMHTKLINMLKKSCTAFLWQVYELYLRPYQRLADGDIRLARFTAPYSPVRLPGGCWMVML